MQGDRRPQRYEVCVSGHLGETIRAAFPACRQVLQRSDHHEVATLPSRPPRSLAGQPAACEAPTSQFYCAPYGFERRPRQMTITEDTHK